MKFKTCYFIVLLLSFQACVTIKHGPIVYNQTIVNGAALKKLKVPSSELFVFNNPKKLIDYTSFLSQKFNLRGYTFAKHITVHLNGEDFDMFTYTPKTSEDTYNILGAVLDEAITKNNHSDTDEEQQEDKNEKYIYENEHHYVMIAFSHNGEDCLATSSLYYNLASNYLKKLAAEYFQSVNEN